MNHLSIILILLSFSLIDTGLFAQSNNLAQEEIEFEFDLSDLSSWSKEQSRREEQNARRLKAIALAALSFEAKGQLFPFGNDKKGKSSLSWRVQILEQLAKAEDRKQRGNLVQRLLKPGENNFALLVPQVDYKKPWNLGKNTALHDKMPVLFGPDNKPDIFWVKSSGNNLGDYSDGLRNTISFVHIPPQKTNWMKRQPIDVKSVLKIVDSLNNDEHILVAFIPGKVMRITNRADRDTLRNLMSIADGKKIEWWKLDYENQIAKRKKLFNDHIEKANQMIKQGQLEDALTFLHSQTPSVDHMSEIQACSMIVGLYERLIKERASSSDKDKLLLRKIANWQKNLTRSKTKLAQLKDKSE